MNKQELLHVLTISLSQVPDDAEIQDIAIPLGEGKRMCLFTGRETGQYFEVLYSTPADAEQRREIVSLPRLF